MKTTDKSSATRIYVALVVSVSNGGGRCCCCGRSERGRPAHAVSFHDSGTAQHAAVSVESTISVSKVFQEAAAVARG